MSTSSARQTSLAEDEGPVYFWKPEQEDGYLGQWYESEFTDPKTGIKFQNAEQWLMYQKAMLFAPESQWPKWILASNDPKAMKAMGRKVPDFDEKVWNKNREQIVYNGNMLKFGQDEGLKAQLLATGNRELVEASPLDRIWGVGFGKKNAGNMRHKWGYNLLGKALERVRADLRKQEEEKEK